MSRRLERFLQIDTLVRSPSIQTSKSIAESLEVCDRTIRNDLDFLRDRFGAPLEYSKKQGWHYTDSEWRLPSISLSQGELFALTLGARMLEAYAGSAYETELRTSIARLSKRLPDQTRVDLQQLADERIIFRSGAQMVNLEPTIFQQLVEACRTHRKVWIHYYGATRNQESQRTIDPYFVDIYRGSNPYAIAFCNLRQDYRDFRIDRIKALQVLEQTFERNPNFNAREYLDKRFQHERGDRDFAVAIWFDATTAPFIRERIWHKTQEITEHANGSLTLHMVTSGLNDLKRWVLFYGKGAIVQAPSELVALVRGEVEQMHKHYHSQGEA